MQLNGKVVFITGAAAGIGNVTAHLFSCKKATVFINDVNEEKLNQHVEYLRLQGGEVYGLPGDVTDKGFVINSIEEIISVKGKLDILVNNAGGMLGTPKDLENVKEEDWDKVIDLNLKAPFLLCQAAIPYMKERKYGKIINVSSRAARTGGIKTGIQYASAKAGIFGLTRHIARKYGKFNICANAIVPSLALTSQWVEDLWDNRTPVEREEYLQSIPLGRFPEINEIANTILFLASDYSSYLTGVILDINGGVIMS